jgi:hypothetical protein
LQEREGIALYYLHAVDYVRRKHSIHTRQYPSVSPDDLDEVTEAGMVVVCVLIAQGRVEKPPAVGTEPITVYLLEKPRVRLHHGLSYGPPAGAPSLPVRQLREKRRGN